jgi:hypothetical protein
MTLSSPTISPHQITKHLQSVSARCICFDPDIIQIQGGMGGGLGIPTITNGGGQFIYMSAAYPTVAYCWISAEI